MIYFVYDIYAQTELDKWKIFWITKNEWTSKIEILLHEHGL